VTLDHIDPMCSLSLSSIHTGLHAIILFSKPYIILFSKAYTLGFGFILG
jgi:hypothetical protein